MTFPTGLRLACAAFCAAIVAVLLTLELARERRAENAQEAAAIAQEAVQKVYFAVVLDEISTKDFLDDEMIRSALARRARTTGGELFRCPVGGEPIYVCYESERWYHGADPHSAIAVYTRVRLKGGRPFYVVQHFDNTPAILSEEQFSRSVTGRFWSDAETGGASGALGEGG